MDPVKIYAFALITLALLLAVLTWHLLSEKKKQHLVKGKELNGVYIFIVFFMIIFMMMLVLEFYKGPQIVLKNLAGYEIVIDEEVDVVGEERAFNLNEGEYYVDPKGAFYIKLPETEGWSKPKVMNGLRAYVEQAGMETNKTNLESFLKWNPYKDLLKCIFTDLTIKPYMEMIMCLDETLGNSPYGKMLKMSYATVLEFGKPVSVNIKIKDGTPFNIFEKKDTSNPSKADSLKAISDDGTIEEELTVLNYVNYINITVLDKSTIPANDQKLTLANYFLKNTINLSSNAEKIIAINNNMLFTSSIEFKNAQYKDWKRDLKIQRWVRMLEEPDKIYVLEMAYSPDTDLESVIWNDLKSVFESFTLVSE